MTGYTRRRCNSKGEGEAAAAVAAAAAAACCGLEAWTPEAGECTLAPAMACHNIVLHSGQFKNVLYATFTPTGHSRGEV